MPLTLRFDKALSESETKSAAQHCREAGASRVALRANQHFDCTYAALEVTREGSADRIRAQFPSAVAWEFNVIALAIEPHLSQVLPLLEVAFGGPGKPAGVLRCEPRAESVILEIAERRTSLALILTLVDVELRRYGNAGRRIHALSPLSAEVQAGIASRGLQLPHLDGSQILEVLIEQSHA